MTHIHWVARQNKLEIPRDKYEVNKWEIYESDGWAHDPDTMVDPLTPKSTHIVEDLVRTQSRKHHSESPGPTYQPKYRWDTHHTQITHPPITRMRWASARSRDDDHPTDTQADTHSRSPRQGVVDHCLTSRRRRSIEEVDIVTVLFRELYSWD